MITVEEVIEVTVTEINPNQEFYDDLVAIVDPFIYDGRSEDTCLIGQYAMAKGIFEKTAWGPVAETAQMTGVPYHLIKDIFLQAYDHDTNLASSLKMARKVLGI